ncbi:MAG: UPF0149 family protein [Devosia sp.]|uniref:UPF0149 family protein n=1 Tax=Devosia sp. TaxID=1871048 RepID=UPI0024C82443|nr:UPF0149 family protein [Devosia sp.]UYN99465.1 MAG: UPF0149 family protein [Devosia sp.]
MTQASTDLPESLQRLEYLLTQAVGGAESLSALDGYLAGVLASPDPISRREWWPGWLVDAGDAELDRAVAARFAEIEAELAAGRYAPLYDVDDQTGEIDWPQWLAGFEQAMQLRFALWDELLRHPFQDVLGEAATRLATALLMAQPGFGPDDSASEADWAAFDAERQQVPRNLAIATMLLYQAAHRRS